MSTNLGQPNFSIEQLRQMAQPRMSENEVGQGSVLAPQNEPASTSVPMGGPNYSLADLKKLEAEKDPFGGIKAGAAAVGRGLSFGLSDVALTGLGIAEPQTLKALEEAYPTTSTIGEIGGVVAPALLSGGTSLLASGARAAGSAVRGVSTLGRLAEQAVAKKLVQEGSKATVKKVLGKAFAAGVGSAVEGSFYGAGQVISDAALGDPNVNAEKFFSQVGLSALVGGAFGSTFNIAGQGIKAAANNYKKLAKSAYGKINNLDEPELNYIVKNMDKLDEVYNAPGDKAEKIKSITQEKMSNYFSRFKEFGDDFGKTFEKTVTTLDNSNQNVPFSSVLKQVDDLNRNLVGEKGLAGPAAKRAAKSIEEYKQSILEAAIRNSQEANLADDLLKQFKNFSGSKKDYKKLLDSIANNPNQAGKLFLKPSDLVEISRRANEEAASRGLFNFMVETKPGAFEWNKLGQFARDQLGEMDKSNAIKTWNAKYGAIANARKELKKFGLKGTEASYENFEDKVISLMTSGTSSAKKASKWLGQIDEVLGTDLKDTQDLLTAYSKLTSGKFASIPTGYSTLLPALSAVTGFSLGVPAPIVGAATLGAAALQAPILRRPIIKGALAAEPAIEKGFQLLTKTGQAVPSQMVPWLAAKTAGLAYVERSTKKADQDTAGALKQYLNNPSQFSIETRAPKMKKNYLETFKDYQDLISDDLKFNEYLDEQMKDLGLVYPSIVEPLKGKTKQSIDFLLNGAPKPYDVMNMFDDPLEPSDQEIGEFRERMEVVEDPRAILKALKKGELSKNQVETLQKIYPALYENMKSAFVEEAQKAKSNLNYYQKLQLSMLFGIDALPALKAENFALLQANFAEENKPKPSPPSGGVGLRKIAESYGTEAQGTLG